MKIFGVLFSLLVSLNVGARGIIVDDGSVPTPSTPSFVIAPATSSGSHTISWMPSSGMQSGYYSVAASVNNGIYSNVGTTDSAVTSISFTGLVAGSYIYRVMACNYNLGSLPKCSGYAYSGVVAVSASMPSTPSAPTGPSSSSSGNYVISWTQPSGTVSSYTLQERKNSGTWSTVSTSNILSKSFSGKTNATYDYQVKACNSNGCSAYSSYKRVTVALSGEYLISDATLINPSVPAQENVGAVSGSAGVSGGAASYTIPIQLAPGRNGMQPSVSLNYSSRSGYGIAGVGWSLSAGSGISRCAATPAQDGFTESVNFNATTDRLCLDGERLVLVSGTYGASGAEYRTELDRFVRVKQIGSINGINTSFAVEHNDGLIQYYGDDSYGHGAEVIPYGKSYTLSWLIYKAAKDSGNNNIFYKYDYDATNAEAVLKEIEYTGSGASEGNRKVIFNYADRDHTSTSYLSGGRLRQTKRLDKIISQYGSQQVASYQLNFEDSLASKRSLLKSIKQCGNSDSQCLPQTNFDWLEHEPQFETEQLQFKNPNNLVSGGNPVIAHTDKRWLQDVLPHGDVNGDGVKDWTDYYVNAEKEITKEHNNPIANCYRPRASFTMVCLDADLNADGKTDSIRHNFTTNKLEIRMAGQTTWLSTGITWLNRSPSGSYSKDDRPLGFADFNGDGWVDLAFKENSKLNIYFHTKNLSAPYSATNYQTVFTYTYYSDSTPDNDADLMGDMDGNGIPDIVVQSYNKKIPHPKPESIILLKSLSGGGMTTSTRAIDLKNSFSLKVRGDMFADINGDGLTDILTLDKNDAVNPSLMYRLNDGTQFIGDWIDLGIHIPVSEGYIQLISGESDNYYYPSMSKILLMDYDGDGRQEILYASQVVASGCKLILGEGVLCDDNLYGLADTSPGKDSYTEINSQINDDSVRRYNAIRFDEDQYGAITTYTFVTDIIASASQTAVVDATGDGLPDVVTVFGCRFSGCTFNTETNGVKNSNYVEGAWINRNLGASSNTDGYEPQDMMVGVTNRLGANSHWVYRPLSSDEYNTTSEEYYTPHNEAIAGDPDYFHFASSMYTVAAFSESDGIGGTNETRYRYEGAMYNNKGRGFQGFLKIVVDNPNNIRAVTDFYQKFPLTGQIEQIKTCLADNNDPYCDNHPLTETHTGYTVTSPTTKSKWVLPVKSETTTNSLTDYGDVKFSSRQTSYVGDTDPGTISENMWVSSSAYDSYGNILKSVRLTDSGFGESQVNTVKTYDYSEASSSWWVKLTSTSIITKALNPAWSLYDASLDGDKSLLTEINSYDSVSRQPKDVTLTPSTGKVVNSVTVYNAYGLPTKITTNASGETSRYVNTNYTDSGSSVSSAGYFPYQITNQKGHVTTRDTDPRYGQAKQIKDANANISYLYFDAFGRSEKVTPPSGTGQPMYTRYAWCENGCDGISDNNIVFKITSYTAGAPQTAEYKDALGRTLYTHTQGFDGSDIYTNTIYDNLGRVRFQSIPDTSPYHSKGAHFEQFDVVGRLTQKIVDQPDNKQMIIDYTHGVDGNPYRTRISVNNADRIMYRTYNGVNQLMQTTDAMGNETQYAYDGQGNPIVLRDANLSRITAKYNALGQKLEVKDPNMGTKTFTYTGFGEVDTEKDANTHITDYNYDVLGRIVNRKVNNSLDATIVYDTICKGTITSETVNRTGENYSRASTYDSYCRPKGSISSIDGNSYKAEIYYDGNYGRIKGKSYPNSLVVAYEYNARGYLDITKNANTGTIYRNINTADVIGNWTQATLSNNAMTVNRAFHLESGQMISSELKKGSLVQQLVNYPNYDDYGNLKTVKTGTRIGGTYYLDEETYGYDQLHRLTSARRAPSGGTVDYNQYDYDAVGNFKYKDDFSTAATNGYQYGNATKTAGGNAGPNAVRKVLLNNGRGTRTYTYDNNGNLTNDGTRNIAYNAFNKPTQITVSPNLYLDSYDTTETSGGTIKFYYGADQMRYKQVKTTGGVTTTTIYIDKLYEEIKVGSKTEKRAYVDDIAVETTIINGTTTNKTSYVHRDRLGSMIGSFDASGNLLQAHSYDAFGKPRDGRMYDNENSSTITKNWLSDAASNRGFTDHEHLDDAQYIHMNGRVYDYNLGRFLSVDPFIQSPGNSQSMNPYSYVMNNPLAGKDPSGYAVTNIKKHRINVTGSHIKETVAVSATIGGERVTIASVGDNKVAIQGGDGKAAIGMGKAAVTSGASFKQGVYSTEQKKGDTTSLESNDNTDNEITTGPSVDNEKWNNYVQGVMDSPILGDNTASEDDYLSAQNSKKNPEGLARAIRGAVELYKKLSKESAFNQINKMSNEELRLYAALEGLFDYNNPGWNDPIMTKGYKMYLLGQRYKKEGEILADIGDVVVGSGEELTTAILTRGAFKLLGAAQVAPKEVLERAEKAYDLIENINTAKDIYDEFK